MNPSEIKMFNHLEFNYNLGNKKCLYYNIKFYYSLINRNTNDIIPLTFHIQNTENEEFKLFKEEFLKKQDIGVNGYLKKYPKEAINNNSLNDEKEIENRNIWIIKPGENTNRGNGITISNNFNSILKILQSSSSREHTYIIQKYIENPLLIDYRKFDIRCFCLLTSVNGNLKGFLMRIFL